MDALLSGTRSESSTSSCVKLIEWRWNIHAAANKTIYFSGTPYFAWGLFQAGSMIADTAFCINVGETYTVQEGAVSEFDFSVTLNQTECLVQTSQINQKLYIVVMGQR